MRRARNFFAALLLLAVPAFAGAQEAADSAVLPADFASPFLPVDHWAHGAVRRLEGLGLAPAGYVTGVHALTQRRVAIVLEHAATRVAADAAWAPQVDAYRARYAAEFGAVAGALYAASPRGAVLSGSSVSAAIEQEGGRVRGGVGFPDSAGGVVGPAFLPDRDGVRAGAALRGVLLPHFAFGAAADFASVGDGVTEAYVAASRWNTTVWAGRRALGFGQPAGGGLVLNASTPLDGGGLVLNDPVLLPSFLRALGPIQFETMLAKLERNGTIAEPWFWTARGTLAPHPRLQLGLTRGVMFGGEGTTDISLRNVVFVFIGKHGGVGSEFDNHVISLDARYRPPLGALPLQLYIEWGFEDSAGAYKDVPGIVAGAEVAALPGLPQVSAGIECASFTPMCCGNPTWYRHWLFTDGWAVNGALLGHPLGGHGTEWLAYASADLLEARLRLTMRAFRRDRGSENLFAPDRAGTSNGAAAGAELRATSALDVVLRAAVEEGASGWRQSRASGGVRVRF